MSSSTAPASSDLAPRRVLLVDSDVNARELYRAVFVERGWAVTEASDGREALVRALSERPSVVVTELWLALIDGVALCRLLRRDWVTQHVPILVVTSEVRASYLKQAEGAGANAVLTKPTRPDVIVAAMERLIEVTSILPAVAETPPRRKPLSKAHLRFETTTPDEPVPHLVCPICTQVLVYRKTFFGGVNGRHPERWDYLQCPHCGEFEYRHRTRKFRQLA